MTDMPLLDIDLPIPRARTRGTFLDVASPLPESAIRPGGVDRWVSGVTFSQYLPIEKSFRGPVGCAVEDTFEGLEFLEFADQPAFLMWDAMKAQTRCRTLPQLLAYLRNHLVDYVSTLFAAEFENPTSGGEGLLSTTSAVASGAEISLQRAIPLLEDTMSGSYPNAEAVISTTPGFYNAAYAAGLADFDAAGVLRTASGTALIGDGGHSGQGTVGGHAASSGESAWTYITLPPHYAISRPRGLEALPNAEDHDLLHNQLIPVATRYGLVVWDFNAGGYAALVSYEATGG